MCIFQHITCECGSANDVSRSEGVSLVFLIVWFLGDIANLMGALWADLLPNVVLLAVWFCFADAFELSSAIYYRFFYTPERHAEPSSATGPQLLSGMNDAESLDNVPLVESEIDEPRTSKSKSSVWIRYCLPVLGVLLIGTIGFLFSGSPKDNDETGNSDIDSPIALGPQVLGYMSAMLYLTARIPQIIQNYRKQSVYGLSLLFFIFSTCGNITYAAQILLFSTESRYIVLNMSWLLGSLGTVSQDAIIFTQFYIYRERRKNVLGIPLNNESALSESD